MIRPIVLASWGPEKSQKSSLLYTLPKPIRIYDFDMGSDRAAWIISEEGGHCDHCKATVGGLIRKTWFGSYCDGCLSIMHCPTPVHISIQKNEPIKGFRELWTGFVQDYLRTLADPRILSVVIDTATQAWSDCCQAYLQELQEKQLPLGPGQKLREKLIPIEYAEPNARMRAVEQAGKGYGKFLGLSHYQGPIYAQRFNPQGQTEDYDTGEKQLDGFKHTANLSDIVVRTRFQDGASHAVVTICGLSMNMVGVDLTEPSYEKLMEALSRVRG